MIDIKALNAVSQAPIKVSNTNVVRAPEVVVTVPQDLVAETVKITLGFAFGGDVLAELDQHGNLNNPYPTKAAIARYEAAKASLA